MSFRDGRTAGIVFHTYYEDWRFWRGRAIAKHLPSGIAIEFHWSWFDSLAKQIAIYNFGLAVGRWESMHPVEAASSFYE